MNTRESSYGLKHRVEEWSGEYVCNGAFIAAVLYMGIPYRAYDDSPNIDVAISSACPMMPGEAANVGSTSAGGFAASEPCPPAT